MIYNQLRTDLFSVRKDRAVIISLYKGKGTARNHLQLLQADFTAISAGQGLRPRAPNVCSSLSHVSGDHSSRSRSTILALRLLAEVHREFRKPLHVAYIDIKAAFDSVDRQALWKALRATGDPQFLIQLIQAQRHEFEWGRSCRKHLTPPQVCAKMCSCTCIILSGN